MKNRDIFASHQNPKPNTNPNNPNPNRSFIWIELTTSLQRKIDTFSSKHDVSEGFLTEEEERRILGFFESFEEEEPLKHLSFEERVTF